MCPKNQHTVCPKCLSLSQPLHVSFADSTAAVSLSSFHNVLSADSGLYQASLQSRQFSPQIESGLLCFQKCSFPKKESVKYHLANTLDACLDYFWCHSEGWHLRPRCTTIDSCIPYSKFHRHVHDVCCVFFHDNNISRMHSTSSFSLFIKKCMPRQSVGGLVWISVISYVFVVVMHAYCRSGLNKLSSSTFK